MAQNTADFKQIKEKQDQTTEATMKVLNTALQLLKPQQTASSTRTPMDSDIVVDALRQRRLKVLRGKFAQQSGTPIHKPEKKLKFHVRLPSLIQTMSQCSYPGCCP